VSLVFGDIRVGDEVTPLVRGPLTSVHLMRWSAASENWHRIHYDDPFAREHEGLPGLLVNGSWKQHFLVQTMCRWLAPTGWLAEIAFEFRRMDLVGSTLTAWGTVTETYERDGLGFVRCDIGIRNDAGAESTPGTATGVLPLEPGERVPHPFPDDAG
jgi:acyl dehydratase